MKKFTNILIFVLGISAACGQKTFDEKLQQLYANTVPLIVPDSLKTKLANQNIYIIDTRTQKEFEVSHLPNARFLDYDNYSKKDFNDIPKDAEVIVYCSVGYRSERVGEKMQKFGFSNVKNLYGGIFEWKNTDKTIVNMKGVETDSVHTYNKNWSQWLEKGVKIYE